ncbi:hypothetical protein ABIE50_004900 [Chitinophaga sp. OAE865]
MAKENFPPLTFYVETRIKNPLVTARGFSYNISRYSGGSLVSGQYQQFHDAVCSA